MVKREQKITFLSKRKGGLDVYYPKSGIFKSFNFSDRKMTKVQGGSYNYYTNTGLRIKRIKPKLTMAQKIARAKARRK